MKFDRFKDRNKLFWILQTCGWLSLWIFYILHYSVKEPIATKEIMGLFITYFTGFWVSTPLRYFYKYKINYQVRSILSLSVILMITSLLSGQIWFWVDIISSIPLHGLSILYNNLVFSKYLSSAFTYFFTLLTWSALYFLIKFYREWSIQRVRTEKANRLAQSAQLKMLRYQLNPHFLFNSLNSIRALIEEDKNHAKTMITELSEFLRYSLISKDFSNIPLNNELEAIRHYFAIEKIRYEEKLKVSFEIDPLAEDFPVLSFLIHPLVENAIKYGMQTSSMPLKIRIKAAVEENTLTLQVCNSGKWVQPVQNKNTHTSTGTGLDNIHQRLENAFPNDFEFKIIEQESKVCIQIKINKKIETD